MLIIDQVIRLKRSMLNVYEILPNRCVSRIILIAITNYMYEKPQYKSHLVASYCSIESKYSLQRETEQTYSRLNNIYISKPINLRAIRIKLSQTRVNFVYFILSRHVEYKF